MPTAGPLLVVLGVLAFIAVIFVFSRRMARQRTDAMQQVSLQTGFSFDPAPDLDQFKAWGDLPLYHRGNSSRARNVMSGRVHDEPVTAMDFRYTVSSGKSSHVVAQTVALFPGADHSLPDMEIRPETALHKIGQAFGYQDIDFESNEEFSRQYLVRGADETAIRAALDQGPVNDLAGQPGWSIEVRSGTVAVYRATRTCRPEDVVTFLEDAHGILRCLRRA